MDKKQEIKTIIDYIEQRPADNCDLFTLLHEIGQESFLKVIDQADGRAIILYHLPGDEDKCDPPIHWKYHDLG